MKQNYDLNSKSFKLVRIVPGLITIILLTSPLWATLFGFPELILYYVAFLSVYWFYKMITTNIGNMIVFRRYKRAMALDWDKMNAALDWNTLPNPEQLPDSYEAFTQVVLLPFYKEPFDVLHATVESIKQSTFDLKKIILVLAIEESGGEETLHNTQRLVEEYKEVFKDIRYYVHPKNVPGEAVGIAGPNLNFAARGFVRDLQEKGENLKNYLVIKYDSDMLIHKNFISNLVHTYLVSADRYHAFYSPAVMLYSNNYWQVPLLMRVFSGALTIALMSEWVTSKRTKQAFSCYGFCLQLLHDIDYLDPFIGVDDTGFYWRAFLALKGHFRGEEFYAPAYNDAVQAETYLKTHVVQYKQLRRWGWGAIVYPMTLQSIASSNGMSVKKRLASLGELFRVYNLYTTLTFLLTFGIPIVALVNPDFSLSSAAHVLPKIISSILTLSLLGIVPVQIILEAMYGPPPKERGFLFFLWHYVEQIMLLVFSLTFGFFPYFQAQIEMMFGKSMVFIVTPKLRKIVN